jgi:hypothetical protein
MTNINEEYHHAEIAEAQRKNKTFLPLCVLRASA